MKTKGFTLVEMLIAMSLMGLILTTGGRLYKHLQAGLLAVQEKHDAISRELQARQVLQRDVFASTQVLGKTDSSFCLIRHPFDAPVCYVWRDSLVVRKRATGQDSLRVKKRSWEMFSPDQDMFCPYFQNSQNGLP